MKRRIILFLLNRFGRKKEQSGSGGKAAVGIGCLSAFFMGPFLAIFLFFAIIVWIATSLFACTAKVVLSDVLGVEISEEDEQMLRDGLNEQKEVYDEVEADFEAPDTLTAHLYSEIGGQRFEFYDPEPEYGAYKTIEIGRDNEYIGVEYQKCLSGL